MKQRFVNFRPILLVLLSIVVGILCAYASMKGHSWVLWVISALLFLVGITFLILKKYAVVVAFSISLMLVFAGFFNFNLNFNKYTAESFNDKNCWVSGKFTDYYAEYDDSIFVVLKQPVVRADNNVKSLKDKNIGVWIYLSDGVEKDFFKDKVGSFVDFNCLLNNAPIFQDGINTFYIRNDIAFIATSVKNFNITEGRASFDELARQYIRTTLNQNMTEDTASVAIALLLGDKSALKQDLQNGYRVMGISHVFAVSGLHIGFIYSLIGFFIFKLRVIKWKAIPITFFPMLFYAWLCGFSASVMRALLMSTCSLICQGVGAKNDSLSSICFSASLILCICPFYLFDAGFLMSFSAVIGINCISRILLRYCMNAQPVIKFLLTTLFVSFGATVGVMGLVAHFYGEFTLWGFLFNVIITPFISVVFVLLLVGLIPFMKFILFLPKYFFIATNFLAQKFTNLDFGTFEVKSFGIALLFLFVAMFVFGGYFNLNVKLKIITISTLLCAFLTLGLLITMPKKTQFAVESFNFNSDYGYVITDNHNNAYVISDFEKEHEVNQILNFCLEKNIKEVYLFVLDYSRLDVDNLNLFSDFNCPVKAVFVQEGDNDGDNDLFLYVSGVDKFTIVNGHKLQFADFTIVALNDANSRSWYLSAENAKLLFCGEMKEYSFDYIYRNFIDRVDIVFSSYNEEYIANHDDKFILITNNYIEGNNVFSSKVFGRLTIDFDGDKIIVVP